MWRLKNIIILLWITCLPAINAWSADNKTVNILVWWKYFDEPSTSKLVKEKCGATVSYDNYISNDDLFKRFNSNADKYDILIFSQSTYNLLKDKISLKNSTLSKVSNNYNPTIKQQYLKNHFPPNVAYFAHTFTGFIWNPNAIQISKDEPIENIFKKAAGKKVILIDDPVEINMLLAAGTNMATGNPNNHISLLNFKKLSQLARVYVSNEVNKIYSQDDFAFSYQWSGVAFSTDENIEKTRFTININLSYVSSDLIAELKNDKVSACVANVLASKDFLTALQIKTGYFSPFGNIDTIPNGKYKQTYKQFLSALPNLHWLKPPSSEEYKRLNLEWDRVKYELTQNRE